nr:TetR/AcrR family transcriptional regulator [Streptomyces sp. DSM 41633]
MAGERKGTPGNLTADDWVQAGYALLASDGMRALKIERLCEQVGATRGSFYWHFTDMKGYRAALVASWNAFLEQDRRALAELEDLPPRERLSQMMRQLLSPRHWTLERAIASRTMFTAAGVEMDRSMIRNGSSGSASGSERSTSAVAASRARASGSSATIVGGANEVSTASANSCSLDPK